MDKYMRQLYLGCSKKCGKYFCLKENLGVSIFNIAEALNKYGDRFLCHNIESSLTSPLSDIPTINAYFQLLSGCQSPVDHDQNNICNTNDEFCKLYQNPKLKDYELFILGIVLKLLSFQQRKNSKHELIIFLIRILNKILMLDVIDAECLKNIAEIISDRKAMIEIITEGIKDKNWSIDAETKIESEVQMRMEAENMAKDSVKREENSEEWCNSFVPIAKNNYDLSRFEVQNSNSEYESKILYCAGSRRCFFYRKMRLTDFVDLAEKAKNYLRKANGTIRNDKKLFYLLVIGQGLVALNKELNLLPPTNLYFDLYFDLRNEYRAFRAKQPSVLDFIEILPLTKKGEYLKHRHLDSMRAKLQETFFRSLYEGVKSPYFDLSIRREFLYNDAILIFGSKIDSRKQIHIKFVNEEGVDSGGITKEFFQLLADEIVKDRFHFVQKNGYLFPCPSICTCRLSDGNYLLYDKKENLDHQPDSIENDCFNDNDCSNDNDCFNDNDSLSMNTLLELLNDQKQLRCKERDEKTQYYEAIGRILGVTLYNDVVLNLPFPTCLFKFLLDHKPHFNDLVEIEPEIARSLDNLRRTDLRSISEHDLRFCVDIEVRDCASDGYSTAIASVELVPDGRNTLITPENIDLFVEKYVEFITYRSVRRHLEAIKRGFDDTIADITFLQPIELERLIVGTPCIDIAFVQAHTQYQDYSPDSPIIQYFWDFFKDEPSLQPRILKFITGSDRIPVSRLHSWKMVIHRNGCDTERLPGAQTCFNILLLPEYESRERFIEKFKMAVLMTEGFYLL